MACQAALYWRLRLWRSGNLCLCSLVYQRILLYRFHVLQVGDASAAQSPLSFGGFGAMVKSVGRLTAGVGDALTDDRLDRASLGAVQPYMPSLSAAWLFQRCNAVYLPAPFSRRYGCDHSAAHGRCCLAVSKVQCASFFFWLRCFEALRLQPVLPLVSVSLMFLLQLIEALRMCLFMVAVSSLSWLHSIEALRMYLPLVAGLRLSWLHSIEALQQYVPLVAGSFLFRLP